MAKKTLRKPEYPDDFEDLCLRLWKEIWQTSSIKKNGRKGQSQNGVDIYGKPKYEDKYSGIQCKVKEENLGSYITKEEIENEIRLAKSFQPPLKSYFIATTSSRDGKIQEFVREKDIENTSNSLFEIDIFFWEDIVELLDENKRTYDWFIKNKNFANDLSLKVSFDNNKESIFKKPLFKRYSVKYNNRSSFESLMGHEGMQLLIDSTNETIEKYQDYSLPNYYPKSLNLGRDNKVSNSDDYFKYHNKNIRSLLFKDDTECQPKIAQGVLINETIVNNYSVCTLRFKLKNTGKSPIENIRFTISINGVDDYQIVDKSPSMILRVHPEKYNIGFLENGDLLYEKQMMLVSEECVLDAICFRSFLKKEKIQIDWHALAVDLNIKGVLNVNIEPIIEHDDYVIYQNEENNETDIIIHDYVTSLDYDQCLGFIETLKDINDK